jgi:hypothetical protein
MVLAQLLIAASDFAEVYSVKKVVQLEYDYGPFGGRFCLGLDVRIMAAWTIIRGARYVDKYEF